MFIVPATRDSRAIARLLDDSIDRFFGSAATAAPRSPALDVAESDLAYTVKLEVPGVDKEDVKVTVEGRRVSVLAQREVAEEKTDEAKGEAQDRVVYRERLVTRYSRSFTLPVEVEQGDAGARLENGVLTLTLPKRNPRVAARIAVN